MTDKKSCKLKAKLPEGSRILCAVSGGADSMCLLHMLLEEKDRLGIEVAVAHFEHGLRGQESLRDAEFVLNYCKDKGIECECYQSNHEGCLVYKIQEDYGKFDGIVINPGA